MTGKYRQSKRLVANLFSDVLYRLLDPRAR